MLGAVGPPGAGKNKKKAQGSRDPLGATAKPKKAWRGLATSSESTRSGLGSLTLKQQRALDVSTAVLLTAQQVVGYLRSEHILTVSTKTFEATHNKVLQRLKGTFLPIYETGGPESLGMAVLEELHECKRTIEGMKDIVAPFHAATGEGSSATHLTQLILDRLQASEQADLPAALFMACLLRASAEKRR